MFVGGKESYGELVSVMGGDSVTLMSGVTEIKTNDKIKWEFNGSPLATISIDSVKLFKPDGPFRNRLQLNNQTGDLKISNIKTTDSGLYKPTISSPDGSPPEMTFNVSGMSFLYNSVIYYSTLSKYILYHHGDGVGAERKQILDCFQTISDGNFFSYYH